MYTGEHSQSEYIRRIWLDTILLLTSSPIGYGRKRLRQNDRGSDSLMTLALPHKTSGVCSSFTWLTPRPSFSHRL